MKQNTAKQGKTITERRSSRSSKGRKTEQVQNLIRTAPIGFRQLALQLYEVLDFGFDRFSQTLEVDDTLGSEPHEQVLPDSGGGDRVVYPKL